MWFKKANCFDILMLDVEREQVLWGDVFGRHMENWFSVLHLHINLTGDEFYGAGRSTV
jgi:hypothetical protein